MPNRRFDAIDVEAPARLHLGFLDLNGGLGRRFGSLGLTIDGFATRLRAQRGEGISADGPGADRAIAFATALIQARGFSGGVRIDIEEITPQHTGMGSGTQIALAVGTALERLYPEIHAEGTDCRVLARTLGRGQRSGIGIGAFEKGGFIVDCGRAERGEVPPVALRLPFPEDWRILLVLDQRGQGLHGDREVRAFKALPLFPDDAAGRLCRVLLMQVVPGLIERHLDPVAEGIGEIQRVIGEHFAPAQGGRFASPRVAAALQWAAAKGFAGIGQSSWGPTGFILAPDEYQARWLEQGLNQHFGELAPLRFRIVTGRNLGAALNPVHTPLQLRRTHR
ncbi:beta-ribofuranosylaminobenzene 5'-phosphate synthase family protein [Thiocapsa rosea]|uniref:Beta-ribofuranosylaminobenzene 5'-phosphate synthase n=1 Tax=Thiocapsa rosea TaxID=69360 RepID=A0A495VCN7_9GAMM|nr:beta-ribofuranosylaminobenzene 5'-phosphate synthase family protein [Thiocapsa rosea]RKT47109.1 beta-ribofuranosylaminobenzene 5'-phosphate synthase [Thiocapsa rosea]